MLQTLWQDIRHGARVLIKQPSFTLVTTLTLALGIGANTAIFTIVNTVLLRPLPFLEAERIMSIGRSFTDSDVNSTNMPQFVFWREHSQSFESMAAYRSMGSGVNLAGGDEPEYVPGLRVSQDFFRVIGIGPILGNAFTEEDDRPGSNPVTILSDGLWKRRFGSDPNLVGKTVLINGQNHLVVGILPPDFGFPSQADVFIPLRPVVTDTGYNYRVIGRLKRGVTRDQANSAMKLINEQYRADHANQMQNGESVNVLSYQESLTANSRPLLLVLFGTVMFLLLISCSNVANLQLMRSTLRLKEVAVRLALGARWTRILRQLLTESVMLSLLGGIAGLLFAVLAVKLFTGLIPEGIIPRLKEISVDSRVLLFTFTVSVLTGVIFGLVPALQAIRVDINHELKESGQTTTSAERNWVRSALVISQIALSLLLLIGATLMVRSFAKLRMVELGFDPHHILTFQVALNGPKYEATDKVAQFYRGALERIESVPGVEAVAVTNSLPLVGQFNVPVEIDGQPDRTMSIETRMISPDYFRVLKHQLKRGRGFVETDSENSTAVAIVNEAFAQRYLAGADPLDERLIVARIIGDPKVRQIIGVVGDVKQFELGVPAPPTVFVPISQVSEKVMLVTTKAVPIRFAIRTIGEPLELAPAIKREMLSLDPSLPVTNLRSMDNILSRSIAPRRLNMTLLVAFAVVGLILTIIGIYGVISYSVMQRKHEIGIRMALGAQMADVLRLVVQRGMIAVLIGIGLGLIAALIMTRILRSTLTVMLYETSITDFITFAGVSLFLTSIGLIACYFPARRATKVNTILALRHE